MSVLDFQPPPGRPSAPPDDVFLIKPDMFPMGRIHLLGGAPHSGKSGLVAQLLHSLIRGESWLGFETHRLQLEECGLILTDRQWSDNTLWLRRLGLVNLPHYSFADDPDVGQILGIKPQVGQGVQMLRACLDRLPKTVKVVVADVFTTYFLGNNLFAPSVVALHMTLLQRLLIERGLTLIGLVYGTKQKGNEGERYVNAAERIMGAAPLRGSASTIAYLASHEESGERGYQELWIHSRQGPPQHLFIRRAHENKLFELLPTDLWGEKPAADDLALRPRDREILDTIKASVELADEQDDNLIEGWVSARQVRQALLMSTQSFSNHLKRLKLLGLIETCQKGRFLFLRIAPSTPVAQ